MSVNLHPQYIADSEGNRVSVVLAIGEYRELLEDLEDFAGGGLTARGVHGIHGRA